MWFKNLYVFQLTKVIDINQTDLHKALLESPFIPCGATDTKRTGWVPPLGDKHENLVHGTRDHFMMCLKIQEKAIPTAYLTERIKAKVDQAEEQEARKA